MLTYKLCQFLIGMVSRYLKEELTMYKLAVGVNSL